MSPVKSILVHLDAEPTAAERLRIGWQIGERLDASVTALHAVMPALLQNPTAFAVAASPEIAPLLAEYDSERRRAARALFDAAAVGQQRLHWREAHDEPTRAFVRAALYSDLLVLGQHRPRSRGDADLPADFVPSVLLGSGKPALVLPHIGPPPTLGSVVLLAWKETREAARALAASLPLLQGSREVHVALWDDADVPADAVDPAGGAGAAVLAFLRLHGVAATLHRQAGPAQDVGNRLLSMASDVAADLLVMGCYGHGRAREWALGGATRTVLASMTVPVLMAH
jgi:nucleotide-binding universal stress UspA family protein